MSTCNIKLLDSRKLLEENIHENACAVGIDKGFFGYNTESRGINEQIDKLNVIKIKLCSSKYIIIKR